MRLNKKTGRDIEAEILELQLDMKNLKERSTDVSAMRELKARVGTIETQMRNAAEADEAREDTLRTIAREYLEGTYSWGLEAIIGRISELDAGYEARVEAWDNKPSAGGKIVGTFLVRRALEDAAFGVFVTDGIADDNWMMFQSVYAGESAIGAAEAMMGREAARLRFDDSSIRQFAKAEEENE